jgi:hypothetical protein
LNTRRLPNWEWEGVKDTLLSLDEDMRHVESTNVDAKALHEHVWRVM